jgi:protein-tyrosine-phosphatase/DNA-binding transcriptional ArsR family regulator
MSPDGAASTTVMPEFLSLTGHPVRWQLISELARSDRQVRELMALVGQRQSLTSYHLGQLRGGGLVTARRSSADGRDSYYCLDLAAFRTRLAEVGTALHPGLQVSVPSVETRPGDRSGSPSVRVLFLCTGNSARSQMAAAILEQLAGDEVEVFSAGSHPKALDPDAVRVMRERDIDISDRNPTHLNELVAQHFDHVISLCDRVREVCPDFPGSPTVAHWSIADPSAEADHYQALLRTADDLTTRIEFLLYTLQVAQPNPERNKR